MLEGAPLGSAGPAVEANVPRIHRFDDEMRMTPWIAPQDGTDLGLRRRFDDEHDTSLVGERSAEHDDTVVDEAVHEGGMAQPPGLPFERL